MNIFENNLKLLAKKNPSLATKIRNHVDFHNEFGLIDAMSGDPNLLKNNIPLHDTIDPEEEAIKHLKNIKDKTSHVFNFIYGFGLGYILKRFNKALKGYIIIYEPDLDTLRLVLEMVDFSEELSNKKVFIFDDLNDIEKFYPTHFFYNYDVSTTILDSYKATELDKVQEFVSFLGYLHGIYASNYSTYWDKHHRWVMSLLSNIDIFPKYDELKVLKNKFKDKPAIVISAGPSLNKNIELISKYQDNFVIFCVGTALKSALKYGIKPDFVCFVEDVPVTSKMIDENDANDANIILQPITHQDIYNRKAKNKFVFYADNDEVSKWAAAKLNIDVTDYINRGTVSVNALSSAKILGCNPIILTGQDLAYTNSKCYADGSIYEDYEIIDGKVDSNNINKIMQKTNLSERFIRGHFDTLTDRLYKVKGQNGETLLAPGDYASFIKYFSEIAKIYEKDTKLINSTEGGAQIDGYENIPLASVIEKYAPNPINKEFEHTIISGEKNYKIIKAEILKAIKLFKESYYWVFKEGYLLTQKLNVEEINLTNFNEYKEYLPQFLAIYKKLQSLPKVSLLDLFYVRNTFFINHYLTDDFTDISNQCAALHHLNLLFGKEFEKFILFCDNKLKKINFDEEK